MLYSFLQPLASRPRSSTSMVSTLHRSAKLSGASALPDHQDGVCWKGKWECSASLRLGATSSQGQAGYIGPVQVNEDVVSGQRFAGQ